MHNSRTLFLLFLIMMSSIPLKAQKGTLRGTVYEGETGEPLFSANVVLKNTSNGTTTDFDGKFELIAEPGTYAVEISFIGLSSTTITNVLLNPGEVTVINNIQLKASSNELAEVTVTAEALKNTEEALLTVKRKSANVLDGISASRFKKVGDGNAGEAIKRVPGVSVDGGKYVYVRGLGDRYTKTTLNGMSIPGLDPDRNSLQIDIFPTTIISNMTVLKSAVAELPADFTGGIVNIQTSEFPTKKVLSVSAGIGYNPDMHFQNDALTYNGSNTDFLGFDGGARALPTGASIDPIPQPFSEFTDEQVGQFISDFDPTLAARRYTSPLNYKLGLSMGNQFKLENGHKLGYIFSANYKNSTTHYDRALFGEFQNRSQSDAYELQLSDSISGPLTENNVLLAGLGGLAYKTSQAKYKLTIMHLQNGESRAGKFRLVDDENAVGNSGFSGFSNNLEYNERSLTNVFLGGEHHTKNKQWQIDWRVSPTFSSLEDPDIRKAAFSVRPQASVLNSGEAGFPTRIWRSLEEINVEGRMEVTKNYEISKRDAKVKFGASHLYKQRDYEILAFQLGFLGSQPEWTGDANEILQPQNLFPNGPGFYNSLNGDANSANPNAYSSDANTTGIFISNQFEPILNFKAIIGLRGENYVQNYKGAVRSSITAGGENNFINDEVLSNFNLFPSANLIYALNENMNLRGSYYRSIARPSFKEASFAEILDPLSNRTFVGGLFPITTDGGSTVIWDGQLSETYINNYDLRWELYMQRGELFSVSAFYKTFDDPIEIIRFARTNTNTSLQPRNVGDGRVYGIELEVRKSLDFISSYLFKHISINGNFTFTNSSIDMSPTEFNARKRFEKDGQTIDNTRDMAGQAPYIVNAGLNYNNRKMGLNAGFFYNVKGRTLTVVGNGLFPDVYMQPFHNLKFNLNKTLGAADQMSVSLEVANILSDDREKLFRAFQAQDQVFSAFSPGTTISAGFTYKFQ